MAKSPFLQKFYVYDPTVAAGAEFGGLRVIEGDDGLHVLATPTMVQYWKDQGLLGSTPLAQISGAAKDLLKQVTRGRSESDDEPKRVPRYSKAMQSGAPAFAGRPSGSKRKAPLKAASKNKAPAKKPEFKAPPPASQV